MSVASLCNIQGNGRLSEYFQWRRQDLLGPQQVNSGMELRKTLQKIAKISIYVYGREETEA